MNILNKTTVRLHFLVITVLAQELMSGELFTIEAISSYYPVGQEERSHLNASYSIYFITPWSLSNLATCSIKIPPTYGLNLTVSFSRLSNSFHP